jgi:hypothetical protein
MAFGGDLHGESQQILSANLAEAGVDILVRETFFPEGRLGVLVEAGASSPYYLSLGNPFGGFGLRVISVESNPTFAERHRELGHEIQEYVCGEADRDDVPKKRAKTGYSSRRHRWTCQG